MCSTTFNKLIILTMAVVALFTNIFLVIPEKEKLNYDHLYLNSKSTRTHTGCSSFYVTTISWNRWDTYNWNSVQYKKYTQNRLQILQQVMLWQFYYQNVTLTNHYKNYNIRLIQNWLEPKTLEKVNNDISTQISHY